MTGMQFGWVLFKSLRAFNIFFPMAERHKFIYQAEFSSQKTCASLHADARRPAHIYMDLSIDIHAKHLPEASKMDLRMQNPQHPLQFLSVCELQGGVKTLSSCNGGCSPLPPLHRALRNAHISQFLLRVVRKPIAALLGWRQRDKMRCDWQRDGLQ